MAFGTEAVTVANRRGHQRHLRRHPLSVRTQHLGELWSRHRKWQPRKGGGEKGAWGRDERREGLPPVVRAP